MENVNEALLNRPKLDGSPASEMAAATQVRAEKTQAAGGDSEAKVGIGGTLKQLISSARASAKGGIQGMSGAATGGGIASPARTATANFLKQAWLNLIDSFGATLIYINLHVFGHSVLGEKIFCNLGEEWIPNNLRTNLNDPRVKSLIRAFGLLDKIVLIFLDLVILLALIGNLAILVTIVSFMSKNILQQAFAILQALATLGWDVVGGLFNQF